MVCGKQTSASFFSLFFFFFFPLSLLFVAVAHIKNIKKNGKNYITAGESMYQNKVSTNY